MQTRYGFKVLSLSILYVLHLTHMSHFQLSMEQTGRSYYICAESAEEMKRWMNAMSLAAIHYKVCMHACNSFVLCVST